MFYRLCAGLLVVFAILSAGAVLAGHEQPHAIIAFVSERADKAQIYILDVDHLITYPVSRNDHNDAAPAWSRNSDLAFAREHPDGRDIVVVNPFTGRTRAVNRRNQDESAPAWSPDGDLAYVIGRNGYYDVYVQDGCVEETGRNVTVSSNHSAGSPQWSSAGWLAYQDDIGGINQIVLLDPVTGESSVIRQRMIMDYNPTWFEDRLLALVSFYDDNAEVNVYDVQTRQFRNVSSHLANDSQPAWSPDGRLAFISDRDGNNEIYMFDFFSNTLTNVSHSPTSDIMPSWSPDGRLAYASANGTVYDIMVLDRVPDGTPRRVVSHPAQDYSPVWMP